ncbi:MAG: hypothetical protein WC428_01190 [Candidatus Paceibacterota bacterium]
MKVKIGDKIVDAENEPIMLIFSDEKERKAVAKNIKDMATQALKYCTFPNEMLAADVVKFMKTE